MAKKYDVKHERKELKEERKIEEVVELKEAEVENREIK